MNWRRRYRGCDRSARTLSGRLRDKTHAECAHDLHDRIEAWIAILRERLVKTLASQAGLLCQLHHAVRTSGDSDHMGHIGRIITTNKKTDRGGRGRRRRAGGGGGGGGGGGRGGRRGRRRARRP